MFSDNVSLQNEKLISASKSGDAKTVVSLLNSGADVQTKDKVYIYIYIHFLQLPILNFHSSINFHVYLCGIVE